VKKENRYLFRAVFFALSLLVISQPAVAGKYPKAEFEDKLFYEVVEILIKHGMPMKHNHVSNVWFTNSAIPGSYTIFLYRSDEIPQQAVLDTVKLCMDSYVQRGRKERFRILMYRETADEKRKSGFLTFGMLKPYFELTIGENKL